jgi:hypothetical protein
MAQVKAMPIFATIFRYKRRPKLSHVITRSAPSQGKHADIGVFFLLTYNMLYEIVKEFSIKQVDLTIARSFGTDFSSPQTGQFSFFGQ